MKTYFSLLSSWLFRFIMLGGIFFSSPFLSASIQAWPCSYSVKGYLLYFSPSFDDTYFVINGSGLDGLGNLTPNGKRINNPIDYALGFRLEGTYRPSDCFDFGLRWTHLHSKGKKTVTNNEATPHLWPTENVPSLPNITEPFSGSATSRIDVMYQKAESFFEEELGCIGGCCHFILREAIEWSYIRYHETVTYQSTTTEEVQYHAHAKGIGPQLGVIMLFEPWNLFTWCPNNLTLKVMTTGSMIVANSKAKMKARDIFFFNNNVTQNSFWKLMPEWTLDIGLKYIKCICSHPLSIEIGYEMTNYFRGTSKLIFTEASSPGLSINQYGDFYVQGVYLAIGFEY